MGAQSGQVLYINTRTKSAVITDPATGTWHASGTYAAGKLAFTGSPLNGQAAHDDGSPLHPMANEVSGNLDISGNLTLGTLTGGSSTDSNGFGLTFTPPTSSTAPALVQFGSVSPLTDWLWTQAQSTGSATQAKVMEADPAHRLLIYDPSNSGNATVTLDPGVGGSAFHGPVRIQPQGDIPMGAYQALPPGAATP